jgi:RNA polymerase subunit RPABC4/transcription elongation factor Spt4
LLGILCEDCSFMSPSSSCCYVHSVDVTHHWANQHLFVLHAANKSNAASDTLGIFVQKEGAEGLFLLLFSCYSLNDSFCPFHLHPMDTSFFS